MIWSLIFISYVSLFIFGFLDNIRGPLFPDIVDYFKLTDSQGAFFFSIASLGSFLGGLLAKKLLSFYDPWHVNQGALFFLFLGICGIGWVKNYELVLIFSVIFGVGLGILGVTVNVMVQRASSEDKLRQLMSGLHSCYGLAALLAPFAAAYSYREEISWQMMLMAISVMPLFLIFVVFLRQGNIADGKKSGLNNLSEKIKNQSLKSWLFVMACALYVSSELAASTRLALYMRRQGETPEVASYYVSLFFLGLLISRLLFMKELKFSNYWVILVSSLASIFVWLLGLWVDPLFICLTGLTMGPIFPVSMAYAKELFGNGADHVVAYSISMMSLAVVIMHSLIGWLTDIWNLRWALHLAAGVLVIHVFLILMLSVKLEEKRKC